jgi:hypothetical protein
MEVKLDHMRALGAELTLVPSEGGLTTKKLILDMIEAARELSQVLPVRADDAKAMARRLAGRRPCSRGHRPERTWSPPFTWQSDWGRVSRWSR